MVIKPITISILAGLWPENFIAQIIVFIILVLIIITCYLTYLNVLRYQKEIEGIGQVENNLDAWIDRKEQGFVESEQAQSIEAKQIIERATIEELRQNVPGGLLISTRLDTIERLEKYHIKLNVEALQNLSVAEEDRRWSVKVPGILISISIMLGMLGTFIGLTIMVQNILTVLPEKDGEITRIIEATNNMRGLMSGVSSAFSTTLLGLVGTIIATLLNTYLQQLQIKVFAELEDLTINKLLPHTIPNIGDENIIENITHNLESSFDNLEKTIKHNENIIGGLGQVQEGFKAIVADVQKITHRESSNEIAGIIGQLVEMNNRIKEVSKHYEVKYKNVEKLESIAGKQLTDYNKMMLDITRLPGWFRWVLVILIITAGSSLIFVGIQIYYLFQ